jgi:hypothetical protein
VAVAVPWYGWCEDSKPPSRRKITGCRVSCMQVHFPANAWAHFRLRVISPFHTENCDHAIYEGIRKDKLGMHHRIVIDERYPLM